MLRPCFMMEGHMPAFFRRAYIKLDRVFFLAIASVAFLICEGGRGPLCGRVQENELLVRNSAGPRSDVRNPQCA